MYVNRLTIGKFFFFLEGEQQMTTERNRQVINAAKLQGYEVVDTFGMTISRYKDFLMGNCGCHFHKVTFVSIS